MMSKTELVDAREDFSAKTLRFRQYLNFSPVPCPHKTLELAQAVVEAEKRCDELEAAQPPVKEVAPPPDQSHILKGAPRKGGGIGY